MQGKLLCQGGKGIGYLDKDWGLHLGSEVNFYDLNIDRLASFRNEKEKLSYLFYNRK